MCILEKLSLNETCCYNISVCIVQFVDDMINITNHISINEKDLELEFIRASGPGGQNVNKLSSSVHLRFDVQGSDLPDDVRCRLSHLAKNRINQEGILIIEASRYRSQEQNREDAINRLILLLREAVARPKTRRKTKIPLEAKRRRLDSKRRLSEKKYQRRRAFDDF